MKKLLVTLIMFLCALPAIAQNRATHESMDLSYREFSQCCGEYVSGTIRMDIVSNANGEHIRLTGVLVGEVFNDPYTIRGIQQWTAITNENGATVRNLVARVRFANEEGCGFTIVVSGHVTENANGDIVVMWDEQATIECDNGTLIE